MKQGLTSRTISLISALGLLGCVVLALIPLGCANSALTAPMRYREQHQNGRHLLLPDITIERLQACVDEYAGQLDEVSLRVGATVRVDREGQTQNVIMTGIPESAADFAACARMALRDMAVPALPLRASATVTSAKEPTGVIHNEMANPAVLVEVAIVLGEFVAQHGGKALAYAVTIEVLGAVAVAGAQEMLKNARWRKNCTDGYVNCVASPAGKARGNNWNERRCGTCRSVCDKNKGVWPPNIEMFPEGTVSCY